MKPMVPKEVELKLLTNIPTKAPEKILLREEMENTSIVQVIIGINSVRMKEERKDRLMEKAGLIQNLTENAEQVQMPLDRKEI